MIARADVMKLGRRRPRRDIRRQSGRVAALMETVELLEEGLVANAAVRGERGDGRPWPLVERHPALVKEIRGKGLMIGIRFDSGDTAEAVQWPASTVVCWSSRRATIAFGCARRSS